MMGDSRPRLSWGPDALVWPREAMEASRSRLAEGHKVAKSQEPPRVPRLCQPWLRMRAMFCFADHGSQSRGTGCAQGAEMRAQG